LGDRGRSVIRLNCSGVNTPIPKMQTAYTEPMASASLYLKVKFLNSLALAEWVLFIKPP